MKRTPGWKTKARISGQDFVLGLGLAGAVLFFIISAALSYSDIKTISADSSKISHSHEVMLTLQNILSNAQDAETSQRGFLLTNNASYLAPYQAALAKLPAQYNRLALLTQNDPEQQRHLGPLKQAMAAKFEELKQTIDLQRTNNRAGAMAIVATNAGKADMDSVRSQLAEMTRTEELLREKRIAETNIALNKALTSSALSGIVGILVTLAVGYLVGRAADARRRQQWIQSGQIGLSEVMRGEQEAEELGNSILGYLAQYLGAAAGVIYVGEGGSFQRAASYGVPPGTAMPERFRLKEGLLGEAAAANRPLVLGNVPEGYLSFGSALGQSKPSFLVIVPGSTDGKVNTVLELGFVHKVDNAVLTLLGDMLTDIAIAVRTARYQDNLKTLLEETQRKSEELQVQGEELRVSNEELEEQSKALKESQARLEQQQAELNQTNAQLEEQAQQLETQRDNLEKANASVQMKIRELEKASQYKSDFLANMSHELRTPLNSLLILAKLLADNREDNLTIEQVKYAQTIQSSGNDLLALINDILDLSKIEAGHVDIQAEIVPVQRLAENLRHLFQPIAQQKRLDFTVEVAQECPAELSTDAQRLEQVLKNLMSNAFKFTETGAVSLTIQRTGNSGISFSVRDTGIGITQEQQALIFDAFHQADSTISRKYGGTGLGLSISRELVRRLGGSIHVQSQQGAGSMFSVVVPEIFDPRFVAPRDAQLPVVAPQPPVPPAATAGFAPVQRIQDDRESLDQTRRLLLAVEDDESFANILKDLAHEMGFQALVATTAEEALQLAQKFLPSAIILDVGLPDQSGLAVLDRLKRGMQTRHIPIHVVSASDHTQTALSLGAIGYMLKPVQREQLSDMLGGLKAKLTQRMHRVLIVEDDARQREALSKLLASHDTETVATGTAADCLELLRTQNFDCMVLDLSLPDASGYSLLETLSQEGPYSFPPVIVYTGRDLMADDELKLRRYSKSIIIKGAKSPERLLDEVTLFLHQVVSELPPERQKMIYKALNRDALLEGRRILVVEDDVRNIYAVTNILEPRGAIVEIARNGQEALDFLVKSSQHPALAVDLVLMDIMMPVMDGLAATREIRKQEAWKKLPIIALTAKAMPDDQRHCIEAGANDYMAKPLDVEKLLSLVRVWMPR
ncbi:MAG: response regulator [Rhodospirillales bacterium]|nr:response regulator [Rhodospirillales bacterium]